MAQPNRVNNDNIFTGNNNFQGPVALPDRCIGDDNISTPSNPANCISDEKVIHRLAVHYSQNPGSAIVAETKDVHIVNGASGTLVNVLAAVTGVAAAGAYVATVDVQKSTGGGAFATILTSVLTIDSAVAIRTKIEAAIANDALIEGDILRVIVAVSGGSGTQPQGLQVTFALAETPN